jgi:enterochelin esterase-like enzyme
VPGKTSRNLFAALLLTLAPAAQAQAQAQAQAPAQSTRILRSPFIPDCGPVANGALCRAPLAFRYEEAERRLAGADLAYWTDGKTLNVVARSATEQAQLAGTIQEGLAPMSTSGSLWGAAYQAPQLERAVIEMRLGNAPAGAPALVYRGPQAPPAPPANAVLRGRLEVVEIKSAALGNVRKVSVYVPPGSAPRGGWPAVIATDGEAIEPYVAMIDALIERREIQPVAVVAIWPGAGAGEYLRGKDPDAYARHSMFVQREALPMAQKRFAVTADASRRLLFGAGNGGDWAVQTALREPQTARSVAAFSVTGASEPPFRSGKTLRLYMAAGAYDGPYLKGSRQVCSLASASGTPCTLQVDDAGHTALIWQTQLARVLKTVFPAK